MRCILMGVLLALISSLSAAHASPVTATAAVAWIAPVNDSNGNPLSSNPQNALTGYNIYVSSTQLTDTPAPDLKVAAVPQSATSATTSVSATVGQTLYVYVTAVNAAGQSKLSAPATYVVVAPNATPGIPTNVTIMVTIS